ncbi:PIN domain-containing protein [Rhodoplanes azumiensis]|uniref:PIN domain-containing protein n=1 Tax=Rhodoplanes azumiensis TaxID=1897628 RepID=A0ABW5AQV7_9BRAD
MDPKEPEKRTLAQEWLTRMIETGSLVLSPQSLNECYRVITERRPRMAHDEARLFVTGFMSSCTAPLDCDVLHRAWRVQDAGGFDWWDSLLIASALVAGCSVFLSEDMQHERTIEGMTILDPFKLGSPEPFFS